MRRLTVRKIFIIIFTVAALCCSSCASLQVAMDSDLRPIVIDIGNLIDQNRYGEALQKAKQAQVLCEKKFGHDHKSSILYKHFVAHIYGVRGESILAEQTYRELLQTEERVNKNDVSRISDITGLLAFYAADNGNIEEAKTLYARAKNMSEAKHGIDSKEAASINIDMSSMYIRIADFSKAQDLLNNSIVFLEKYKNDSAAQKSLSKAFRHLALLYSQLGDKYTAMQHMDKAIAVQSTLKNITCADTLYASAAAGEIYSHGDKAKAERHYSTSIKLAEAIYGKDSPYTAILLSNFAAHYYRHGAFDKAEAFASRALAIFDSSTQKNSFRHAFPLSNMANILAIRAHYGASEAYSKRALSIWKKELGQDSQYVAAALHNIGDNFALQGKFSDARSYMMQSEMVSNVFIDRAMSFTSEKQKLTILGSQQETLSAFLSVILRQQGSRSAAAREGLDVWLKRKGIILEAQKAYQDALYNSDDPRISQIFADLARVRSQLSGLAYAGPGNGGTVAHQKRIAALEEDKQRLEGELASQSQRYAISMKKQNVSALAVAQALPAGSVLIDFARVKIKNFHPKRHSMQPWLPAHYLVFVLHPGKGDKVTLLDLGEAAPIEQALADLKKILIEGASRAAEPKTASAVAKASSRLSQLIIRPIRPALGNAKTIFLSPDGALNLLPFEILHDASGRFIIQDYTLNYLDAGRDLIGFGQLQTKANKSLFFGNPAYDQDEKSRSSAYQSMGFTRGTSGPATAVTRDLSVLRFRALPGTQGEVDAIRDVLGTQASDYFTGNNAIEDVLRTRTSPKILHLATHGFFLNDQELPSNAGAFSTDGAALLSASSDIQNAGTLTTKYENPLIRSGFALSGANSALISGKTGSGDGLVTAEKILSLNLRGTELVVLSACESGLGEVKSGEGVFGLRRAFSQAGAKSMVMSMWPVLDEETKDLMAAFYKNLQAGKMDRAQSLRQAALQEMEKVKKKYGHSNPYFWGAFIFAGER